MDCQTPLEQRRKHLRKVIERRTGRRLDEIVKELYRDGAQDAGEVACACTRLAGEKVGVAVVEYWLREFRLADPAEQWAALVPRLKNLLDALIDEEVERRLKKGSVDCRGATGMGSG